MGRAIAADMRRLSPLVFCLLLCSPALAQRSSHEQVKVKALRERNPATGKMHTVGFELSTVLRSVGTYRGTAHLNLVDPKLTEKLTRDETYQPSPNVRLQFEAGRDFADGEMREVVHRVRYGEGNDLKPGDRLDVVSGWRSHASINEGGTWAHVWGGGLLGKRPEGHGGDIVLPGDDKPAR
jgi:hypothetical protein